MSDRMALDLGDFAHEDFGACHVAESPASHGVRLGETVERDRPIPKTQPGREREVCAVVVNDLPGGVTAIGVPARVR